jgi:hypothetical protein
LRILETSARSDTLPERLEVGDRFLQSRRAVDDEKGGPPQTAFDQIVENGTPGFGGFAAHVLDREQHLLPVLAHAHDHEQ